MTRSGLILREHFIDEAAGKSFIQSTQDVEPFIRRNKQRFNEDDGCWSPSRELREVAVVPNIVVEQWLHRYGINAYSDADTPKVLALLDMPEWRFLRTAPGKLSKRPYRCYFKASTPTGMVKRSSARRIVLAK
jgi:hypothetical protein